MRYASVLSAAILVAILPALAQDGRGMRAVYKAPQEGNKGLSGEVALYERSHAVVIGIDMYQGSLPPLKGAVRDARNVGAALKTQGFSVSYLINEAASRDAISELLGDTLPRKVGKEDRVLVFFAGHGVTEGEGDTAEGFLMPFGGNPDKKVKTGISMGDVVKWFGRYPSKHVMFVADACYSGLALDTRAAPISTETRDYLRLVTAKPVRLAFVAGGKGEEANEWQGQGLFTQFLLDGIAGAADKDQDGIITSDELAAFVKPNVTRTASVQMGARQTPQLGRRGEGEFVFLSPRGAAASAAPAAVPDTSGYKAMREKARRGKAREEAWGIVSQLAGDPAVPKDDRLAALDKFSADFPADNPHLAEAGKLRQAVLGEKAPVKTVAAPREEAPPENAFTKAFQAGVRSALDKELGAPPAVSQADKAGIAWVNIPGGTFLMGSESGGSKEKPTHRVTVKSFQMAKTEVTIKQYKACVTVGACTPAHVSDGTCFVYAGSKWGQGKLAESFLGDEQPAVCVDWEQAKAFCEWVGGRLPTEAEWEYAARSAGRDYKYPWGDEAATCERTVINEGIDGCGRNATWPVCSKTKGNTMQGLCDMAGNALEWTQDWSHNSYHGAPDDGSAWVIPAGTDRVVRGGAWYYEAVLTRASYRFIIDPAFRYSYVSFRPVR